MPRKPYDPQGHTIRLMYTAEVIAADGAVVYKSRETELTHEALGLADDFLREYLGITYPDAITLQVDSVSINPDSFL